MVGVVVYGIPFIYFILIIRALISTFCGCFAGIYVCVPEHVWD